MIYALLGVGLLLILATIGLFLSFIWRRVVPTNMVHIVQSTRKTVSYGRGREAGNTYYAIPSWIPKFGVTVTQFPESVFDISLKDYEAYDVGRLPFVVDVRAFFRISDSQIAAQRVANFTELQNQLVGVLQGAVRRILATNGLEQIMQDRSTLGEQFTKEVDEQLKEWGVGTVKMIEFMDIRDSRDSQVISNMMAKEKSRIEKESRVAVADNRRAAEMREIEAKREVELSRTEAEQQVGIRQAEKDREVGIAREQTDQRVQTEAKVTTERRMEVKRVEEVKAADIAKDVAVVRAQQDKEVQVVNSEAERESTIRIAEGKLAATEKEAQGIQAVGAAKAEAEKAMLLAPVNAQITLASEIGSNPAYQQYLVQVRTIEATEAVGKEMAGGLRNADVKVIANGGDIQSGLNGVMDLFSSKGGTALTGLLSALSQTAEGKAVLERLTGGQVVDVKSE